MPDELSRRLFEVLRLEIQYNHTLRVATCRVTLTGETIHAVSRATNDTVVVPLQRGRKDQEGKREVETTPTAPRVILLRSAPGRIRTCTPASGGR